MAVDRPSAKQNQKTPNTDFHKVVAWHTLGDSCAKFLQKGHRVAIVGTPHNNAFETREGEKRYVTEVYADRVFFLERAQRTEAVPEAPAFLADVPNGELLMVE